MHLIVGLVLLGLIIMVALFFAQTFLTLLAVVIGVGLAGLGKLKDWIVGNDSRKERNTNSGHTARYEQLLITLTSIKNGNAKKDVRIKLSEQLIANAAISESERQDLLEQVEEVYSADS